VVTEHTVLSAVGPDRPGLVQEVSEFVLGRGGNIADSRMANLRGQFTIMMLVSGTPETVAGLEGDAAALASQTGLEVWLTPAAPEDAEAGRSEQFRLTGTALDQVGLVYEIAGVLRRFGVNIESMDTELEAAPVTGAPIFAMAIVLSVPQPVALEQLRGELARSCDALNIDWQLERL
jgi:glycine cleavage system transcriptional repressor